MSNCCGDFLRGSLRIILFLLSLLLVIGLSLFISGLFVFARSIAEPSLILPEYTSSHLLLPPIVLLATAILGCYGAFRGHRSSVWVFAVLCIVNTLVLIIHVRYNIQPEDFKEYNKVFKDRMEAYEAQYDWFRASTGNQTANRAWTALQSSFLCCGLKKADDWNKWRPKDLAQDEYPTSCCVKFDELHSKGPSISKKLCPDEFQTRGCLKSVESSQETLQYIYYTVAFTQIILGIFASGLGCALGRK